MTLPPDIPPHGGQLRALAAQFGLPPSELLDFSASIHPVPPSPQVIASLEAFFAKSSHWMTYPDSNYSDLKRAIAAYIGVGQASVVISNGVMPLLQSALLALEAKCCLQLVPAFVQYKRTLIYSKVRYSSYYLHEDSNFSIDIPQICGALKAASADTLLLANPHSPSGVLYSADNIRRLVEAVTPLGVTTIVDEAFIDYAPHESVATLAAQQTNLIVLRSLTKFFSIPGLRIAYAIVHNILKKQIEACMPLWPVDVIAAEAGRLLVNDGKWIRDAREANAAERGWLSAKLSALGMKIYPSGANYLLLRVQPGKGMELWRELILNHRIVVRSCANFEGLDESFLRIGVRTRAENERLIAAWTKAIPQL